MLGAKLAHDVRPFARRGDPDRAAALAIGEAQRGQYASRRSIAHGVEERLYRLVEAAPVGHLAFGHRPRAAATAGEADIKVRTIVERHVDPGRHCGILRCKAFGSGTRPYPRLADRPATPLPEHPARQRGSNKRRQVSWLAGRSLAAAFPGLTPVANYSKLSAYSCGGSCGIRAKSRHRIPFSLLIFEETVISASLKDPPLGLSTGTR